MAAPSRGVVGFVGLLCLFFAGRTLVNGEINMGGKGAPDHWVTFESDPALFSFGVLSIGIMGVFALVHWWRSR